MTGVKRANKKSPVNLMVSAVVCFDVGNNKYCYFIVFIGNSRIVYTFGYAQTLGSQNLFGIVLTCWGLRLLSCEHLHVIK